MPVMDIANVAHHAISYRPLTRADVPDASRVLADAFMDNPGSVQQFPRDATRRRSLELLFRVKTSESIEAGGAHGAYDGARLVGAQLTYPPGTYPVRGAALARSAPGYLRAALSGGVEHLPRLVRAARASEDGHPSIEHTYLAAVGVAPAYQGVGIGRRFAGDLFRRADTAGHPVFLETSNPALVPRYERDGYRTVTELEVGTGNEQYHLWKMLRPVGGQQVS